MNLDASKTTPTEKQGLLRSLGGTGLGVWVIKHVLSPLERRLYRWTGGRGIATYMHATTDQMLVSVPSLCLGKARA
jgi:hypothetical protein